MKLKTWIVGGVAAVALLGSGAFVMVTGAGAQEGGNGLLDRVAAKLGVEPDALRGAVKDARLERVDQALADGRITEEQAAKARERIEQGKRARPAAHQRILRRVRQAIVESSATALGMTPEELRAELKAGSSLADVAESRDVSIDDVKAQIVRDAETKLDQLVADGRLDQERADAALAKLTERLDTIVTRTR